MTRPIPSAAFRILALLLWAGLLLISVQAGEEGKAWPTVQEWREGLLSLGASEAFCQRVLAEEGMEQAGERFLRQGIWGVPEPGEGEAMTLMTRALEELSRLSPESDRFALLQDLGGLLWQEKLLEECQRCREDDALQTCLLFLSLRTLRNFQDQWPEMPGGRLRNTVEFLRDWLSCDSRWHPLREAWQPGIAAKLSPTPEWPEEGETGRMLTLPGETEASQDAALWLCWVWELPAGRDQGEERGLWVPPLPPGSRLLLDGQEWSEALPEGKCLMIPLGAGEDSPRKIRLSLLYPPQGGRSLLPFLVMEKNLPPPEDAP